MLMDHLKMQIQKEYNADINPFHIWLNILSMSVFPVVAKPFLKEVFKLDEDAYNLILKERTSVVPQFVISALKAYEKID